MRDGPSGNGLGMTEPGDPAPSPYPADTSLQATIDDLALQGYGGTFDVDPGSGDILCGSCDEVSSPSDVHFEQRRRIEGASDPAEMSEVLAATCPHCAHTGVIICRYGPEATTADMAVLDAAGSQFDA
jgi:hypothetical protein